MRNLKKFLALVLAMVMAFSLMLTANAADKNVEWTDADQVDPAFAEAVDVLSGMKIYQGTGAGFNAAGTITRAEVAALLYRLTTGDVKDERAQLYTGYGNFTDVSSNDWFAGYVGYCANAGYIKGTSPTTFSPYNKVTGYEVLAMILRAVGYDKNGEFTGGNWQVNVSALGTQLKVLDDVKSTHYADNLYLASRRDVVASILFAAAQLPTVTYTQLGGYSKYDSLLGTKENPSLGKTYFGLTSAEGVIVGNQETGERVTILGRKGSQKYTSVDGTGAGPETTAEWTEYNYPGTSVVDGYNVWNATTGNRADTDGEKDGDTVGDIIVNNSLFLKWGTTIDQFAHDVTFWYNGGVDGAAQGDRDNPRTVYAMFDNVKAEKTVFAGDANLAGTTAVGLAAQSLGKVVEASDMVMGTDNAGNNVAIFNTAFDRMTASHHTTTNIGATGTTSPSSLYKIISNSTNVDGENVLDVVIELNIQSSKIIGLDNVSAFKYVSATTSGTDFLTSTNIFSTTSGFIAQDALVGDSVKTLGAYEIGNHITGTWSQNTVADGGRRNVSATGTEATALNAITSAAAANASKAYFRLGAVATKEGTVVSYHNHDANVPGTGWVVLGDGTKLEQSVLYNTVQANTVPQQSTTATANNQNYGSMTYRFYLDAEGNYIGAAPIVGTEYVYGTYMDFQSQLGTSQYTYRLVGVNLDGEMVTKDVSKYNSSTFNATMNSINDISALGMPYRGDAVTASSTPNASGVQPGDYTGWAVNDAGAMTSAINNPANLPVPVYSGNVTDFAGTTTINSDDKALGAVRLSTSGAFATGNLFATEKTKFIIVSGTGTDTQKVAVYNGISELLGSNRQVTINWAATAAANSSIPMPYLNDTPTAYGAMVNYTMSDFIYAQDATGTSKQADVIFIPAGAVTGVGSSLYYVGNATPLLVNAYGEDATKFAMYVDGERGEYWIEGLVDDTQSGTNRTSATIVAFGASTGSDTVADNHDEFYNLTDTGKKATDGQPIYSVTNYTMGAANATSNRYEQGIIDQRVYIATTMDAQTALICNSFTSKTSYTGALYRVANGTKVVNLNADNTGAAKVWPGITDLATLNQASSLNNINTQVPVVVSCVLSSDNLSVETIYVCYNQTYVD